MRKKIVLIAGEPSGDAIAAKIIPHFNGKFDLCGVGGEKMAKMGFESIFDIKDIAVMGFVEVLRHIRLIMRRIRQTVEHVKQMQPDVVVTIDSPGFAKAVVKKLRKDGYVGKIIHVVAPSVWAYKEGRAKTFARLFDTVLCFLPFEPKYFEKYGMKAYFVGNISIEEELLAMRENYQISRGEGDLGNTVAVTLGSRMGEVMRHIEPCLGAVRLMSEKYPKMRFIIPTLPHLEGLILDKISNLKLDSVVKTDSSASAMQSAIKQSSIAIAKSGTNTMQFLANFIPVVVYYKVHPISYRIIKAMIKIKFVNLLNILANRQVVPELIQGHATAEKIMAAAIDVFENRNKYLINIEQEMLKMLPEDSQKPSLYSAQIIANFSKK